MTKKINFVRKKEMYLRLCSTKAPRESPEALSVHYAVVYSLTNFNVLTTLSDFTLTK